MIFNNKKSKPDFHSDYHLQHFSLMFDGLCPIKILYNDNIIYDDDIFSNKYSELYDANPLISHFNVKIVDFHHSVLEIYGEDVNV